MDTGDKAKHPYTHINMPKVIFHESFQGQELTRTLGLTIDVETREKLTWDIEGFNKFVEEHLIDYCFPPHECVSIPSNKVISMSREAFEFLRKYCDRWKSDKVEEDYNPLKGVLGEWFLHAFASTFFNTKSLYSKVYLHQGRQAVHGFDLVHFKQEDNELGFSLWLGEAKFYGTISSAITAAFNSLKKACSHEYLKSQERENGLKGEIAFINRYAKRSGSSDPTLKKIEKFLDSVGRDDFLKKIIIPVLLVISTKELKDLGKMTREEVHSALEEVSKKTSQDFFAKLSSEIPGLEEINIRLFVLPLGNYTELVSEFEKKIVGVVQSGTI